MKRIITSEEQKTILDYYKSGLSAHKIASLMKIHKYQIYEVLHAHNITLKDSSRTPHIYIRIKIKRENKVKLEKYLKDSNQDIESFMNDLIEKL